LRYRTTVDSAQLAASAISLTGCFAAFIVKISPIESGDSFAVMAIPPGVFLLAGLAAFFVIAFGPRSAADLAAVVQLQIASLELSFG
jgi:hypothetical protein